MVKLQATQPGMLQAVDDCLPESDWCVGPIEASMYIKEQVGEFFQFACTLMCCLLCTGPCMIIIGVFLFLSIFDDNRKERIEAFNTAADAWGSSGRAEFDAANVRTSESGNAQVTFTKETTETDVSVNPENNEAINSYEPLYYRQAIAPPSFRMASGPSATALDIELVFGAEDAPSTFVVTVRPFTETYRPPTNTTEERTDYDKLASLCVKVKTDGSSWSLDKEGGGMGCFAEGNAGVVKLPKDGATYSRCSSCSKDHSTGQSYCTTARTPNDCDGYWTSNKVQMTVRSSNDPLIEAGRLEVCSNTGECDFGTSKTTKVKQAFFCWGIGGFFTLCCYGPMYAAIIKFKEDSPKQAKARKKAEVAA